METQVYHRDDLGAGTTLEGPAIIEQLDSTVLVPPDVTAQIDSWLNIRMAIPEEVR